MVAGSDDLFGRILSYGPSPGTLFVILSRMKEASRLKEVLQGCLRALTLFPEDIRLRKLLAESYLEAGIISQAEGEMDKIALHITELAAIYKQKAQLMLKQRRTREAFQALSVYLVFYPDDQEAQGLVEGLKPPEAPAPEPAQPQDVRTPAYDAEIATPTLAEIFFGQGQIREALGIYEQYLRKHPADEKAAGRLSEIRSSAPPQAAPAAVSALGHAAKAKTEKMIAILESWLEGIRELNRAR